MKFPECTPAKEHQLRRWCTRKLPQYLGAVFALILIIIFIAMIGIVLFELFVLMDTTWDIVVGSTITLGILFILWCNEIFSFCYQKEENPS